MATKKHTVKLAANFEVNLASIARYSAEAESAQTYDRLLDELLDSVIPNLEQFPKIGRAFLEHPSRSAESRVAINRLKTRIGESEIREYALDEYLILYALIDGTVYLLSIKHHKQLSFDLDGFWPRRALE